MEHPMTKTIKSFFANESGATAIEYALIASLIAIAIIGGVSALGTRLSAEFSEVSASLK
jgi:pilus assembly protein Flp/PilA